MATHDRQAEEALFDLPMSRNELLACKREQRESLYRQLMSGVWPVLEELMRRHFIAHSGRLYRNRAEEDVRLELEHRSRPLEVLEVTMHPGQNLVEVTAVNPLEGSDYTGRLEVPHDLRAELVTVGQAHGADMSGSLRIAVDRAVQQADFL